MSLDSHTLSNNFAVWKTVKLGLYKDAAAYRQALDKAGCHVDRWRVAPLFSVDNPIFTCASEEVEVDLVNISVAELGLTNYPRHSEVYARAREFGLELCPAEVGPALRLVYGDQPNDEDVKIAMASFRHSQEHFGEKEDGQFIFDLFGWELGLTFSRVGYYRRFWFFFSVFIEGFCFDRERFVFVLPRS